MRTSDTPFESAYAVHLGDDAARLKGALLKDIQRSAFVYRIDCGGCNGCEIEIFASITPIFDAERFGIKVVSSPRHADILVYTGAVTRSMRVPALRAYHAAPEPKIVVAYGACGSSGGIFHNAYGVWGGADQIVPVDLYIPGCPPTPPATIYGFAVALGLLKQKLHAETHLQAPDVHAHPAFPHVPPALRVAVECSARRLAGYWHGRKLAEAFLGLYQPNDPAGTAQAVEDYIQKQDDPRVVEIMHCLAEELNHT